MTTYVSSCCGGPVMTHESEHEGDTGYWQCATCGGGCEPVDSEEGAG